MKFLDSCPEGQMQLVRVRDGNRLPVPAGMRVTVHGYSVTIECPCGTTWTAVLPSPGQIGEAMCPNSCGHGIDMERFERE
jgi:hypothetical protein